MTIAIMQPYLFPYIGYWQLIDIVDTFIIYDDVNYIKQGYINRNNILINNKAHQFTLEIIGASSNKFINEIKVGKNKQKLLKTFKQSYIKAPYFNLVYPLIERILENDEKNLAKFIEFSLKEISKYLDINTKFISSSEIQKDNNLKAQDKVIDICKKLNGKHYINTIGGRELYKKKEFSDNGIELAFIRKNKFRYKQFSDSFIDNLSIIDVLMFNSIDDIDKFLNSFEFIKEGNIE